MNAFKHILKTIVMLVTISCSTNSEISLEEEERLELNNLKEEIELLVSQGTCTENTTCNFIAFGSKPCGGPWSYLVFDTSINVGLLKEKVAAYNKKEAAFNIKWNIISDCSIVLPPTELACVNGKCTAVY
ncbi:hypothetical protein MNBD_BACTEROID04-1484 [hydrothermal vent metagenome]|uniref:Uncharacterized protein n=1 Tax=hydrothermal vent metagenome TaxID=652676 RepID=A0A3B0TNK9_9ZZZZ